MSDSQSWLSGLYRSTPLRSRFHVWLRWRLFPFERLLSYYPEHGSTADLGCGHGHWVFYLASRRPALDITGIDPDCEKIKVALTLAAVHKFSLTRFYCALAQEFDYPPCDVISLVDVLYLIPYPAQEAILAHAAARLKPGGKILLKEMGETPRWKSAWNTLQESLSVRLLGVTYGHSFYFRSGADWAALLQSLGLTVQVVPMHQGYPYPHLLVTGEKRA